MANLTKQETLSLRQKHIGEPCRLFFAQDPLKIVRASGQYMYDETGNEYLDCINNVCHVGHCHPAVVEAGYQQMKILNTNNRFLHDNLVTLGQKIAATLPEKLSVVYLCNSGSEANDLAMRMARHFTKATEIITMDHAYHGHLTSTMDISPYKLKVQKDGVHTCPPHVYIAPCPDTYRGKYTDLSHPNENLGEKYANEVRDIIKVIEGKGKNVCCFIAESMQSCGGQIVFPPSYLENVYRHVRDHGGVCIADEVQVGFGRVGSNFWAFQTQGVVPDIVTIGKPMGNGHPVSAVVTTREVSEGFLNCGMSYFNTFGGNPVSCAIALSVLDIIEKEHLQQRAVEVGQYFISRTKELMKEFDMIGDVRGMGLFLGIDLVRNRETREPATAEANYIVTKMKEDYRILLSTDGPFENVMKIKPPMCFNEQNCDLVLEKLQVLLKKIKSQEFAPSSRWSASDSSGSLFKHSHRAIQLKAAL